MSDYVQYPNGHISSPSLPRPVALAFPIYFFPIPAGISPHSWWLLFLEKLFAHAHNWKRYWISQLPPFVKEDILEVDARIRSNAPKFRPLRTGRWLCLQPDELLNTQLRGRIATTLLSPVEVLCGTVNSWPEDQWFDTVLYTDVLEHIPDDMAELPSVAKRIRATGHIVLLPPTRQPLYSLSDRTIDNQPRYNHASLLRCLVPSTQPILVSYLDSAGYLLSHGNRMVLQQPSPTLKQTLFWNNYIILISQLIDPLLGVASVNPFLGSGR